METLWLPLLLLTLASSQVKPLSLPKPPHLEKDAIKAESVLSAMEKATDYLAMSNRSLTLTQMMGFSMVQAQLKAVQTVWAKNPQQKPLSRCAARLSVKLQGLLDESFHQNQKALGNRQELQLIMQPGFWKVPKSWTQTSSFLTVNTFWAPDYGFETSTSKCIVQLLGTRNDTNQSCRYSNACEKLMSLPSAVHTYQVTYFLVSRMIGCTEGLFHETQYFMDYFCSNMLNVNQKVESKKYANLIRDLFMENIIFCGFGGYEEFYKSNWLEVILRLQNPVQGCYVTLGICDAEQTALAIGALAGFLYVLTV